jgi:hypothetical protein
MFPSALPTTPPFVNLQREAGRRAGRLCEPVVKHGVSLARTALSTPHISADLISSNFRGAGYLLVKVTLQVATDVLILLSKQKLIRAPYRGWGRSF